MWWQCDERSQVEMTVYACLQPMMFSLVIVVKAGPKFEILGTSDLSDNSNASPAVAQDKLLLKGAKFLYCIGKKPS